MLKTSLAWLAWMICFLFNCPWAIPAVLSFEDFGRPPDDIPRRSYYTSFISANALSGKRGMEYGGVVWADGWYVAGDRFIPKGNDASDWFNGDGSAPFAQPRSGHYALFAYAHPEGLGFATTQKLAGVWLSLATVNTNSYNPIRITISASSNATVLASASLLLTNAKPAFLDTSAFLPCRGIDRYSVSAQAITNPENDRLFFVADDFDFRSSTASRSAAARSEH